MKIAAIKEFRDKATVMFKSNEPILIMRRGKAAGFFLPFEGDSLPLDIKKELQQSLAQDIRASLSKKGLNEEVILADFEKSRNHRR